MRENTVLQFISSLWQTSLVIFSHIIQYIALIIKLSSLFFNLPAILQPESGSCSMDSHNLWGGKKKNMCVARVALANP